MKKLILLLLISATGHAQAEFEKIALTANGTSTSTVKINTQETDGQVNYINATALPVSTATQNALNAKQATITAGTNITIVGATINATVPTVNDASTTVKGIVKLAGDLGGTADLPTVPLKANLASPALTGTPTAPTATAGTNTTQLATTAYVLANSLNIPQLEFNNTDKTVWNNGFGNLSSNTSFGDSALRITSGGNNSAFGTSALIRNGAGVNNSVFGAASLGWNLSGSDTVGFGFNAGSNSVNGTTTLTSAVQGVFVGSSTKSLNDTSINEIVIGFSAVGAGSNTATLGNASITSTILRGAVQTNGSFIKSGATTTDALLAGGGTLANPISGTGTTNFIPKWTGSGTQGNSSFFDNGGGDAGITNASYSTFNIKSPSTGDVGGGIIRFGNQSKSFGEIATETESAGNGQMFFRVLNGGATLQALRLASTGAATFSSSVTVNGGINALIPSYTNDGAADSALVSGAFYKITGSRVIYQKP